jgi:hypothetical protein
MAVGERGPPAGPTPDHPAIDDVARTTASGSPVALIMREQLGPVVERTLLAAINFAFRSRRRS